MTTISFFDCDVTAHFEFLSSLECNERVNLDSLIMLKNCCDLFDQAEFVALDEAAFAKFEEAIYEIQVVVFRFSFHICGHERQVRRMRNRFTPGIALVN